MDVFHELKQRNKKINIILNNLKILLVVLKTNSGLFRSVDVNRLKFSMLLFNISN